MAGTVTPLPLPPALNHQTKYRKRLIKRRFIAAHLNGHDNVFFMQFNLPEPKLLLLHVTEDL